MSPKGVSGFVILYYDSLATLGWVAALCTADELVMLALCTRTGGPYKKPDQGQAGMAYEY